MFSQLGTWCYDRRKLVLGLWLGVLVFGFAVSGRGQRLPRRVQPPRRRVEDRLRHPRRRVRRRGHRRMVGTIVFRADQGVDDPEVRPRCRRCSTRRRSSTTSPGREPLQRGGRQQIASEGPRPGRIASPTSRCPTTSSSPRAGEIRDAILETPPTSTASDRAGRVHLRRVRGAVVRGPRPGVRHRHPDRRVRLGARHGPARRRRPVRHRPRHRDHHLLSHVLTDPRLRHVPRHHDRPRRRHRLRLLIVTRYREQLHAGHTVRESVAIAIDTAGRSVLFAGTTVGDLAARHAADGRQLRPGPRRRRGRGGGRHRGGVADAAARAARLRRAHGSS